ncbi:MAG: transcriptional regulator FeaR [Pseudomonas sp.]|nr:transcriptional regulator FeaR [Pseudomonas sp.]
MNTAQVPGSQGFEHWLHSINQICGAFEAQPLADDFAGGIRGFERGALKMSFVDASHARLYRTQRLASAADGHKYFAVFQLEGQAQMAQGEARARLAKGDITLIDASRPCDFTYGQNSRQLSLILPHAVLDQAARFGSVQCGQTIGAQLPIARLSHGLILEAAQQGPLSQVESEAVLDAVVSLLRPALTHQQEASDPHERLFRRSLAFIEEHLRSDALCPDLLAREVGVSVRGLYRMFSKKGLVVAQYIKHQRLERCAETLRQPGCEHKLSALGYDWGFSDSSYFSTAFKHRFGISPGEYRKRFSA